MRMLSKTEEFEQPMAADEVIEDTRFSRFAPVESVGLTGQEQFPDVPPAELWFSSQSMAACIGSTWSWRVAL
eukprot:1183871-Amphidinium_carterae.1